MEPIQREFVWEPEDVLTLWDSLYRFYRIGSLLSWESPVYLRTHRRVGGRSCPGRKAGFFFENTLNKRKRNVNPVLLIRLRDVFDRGPDIGASVAADPGFNRTIGNNLRLSISSEILRAVYPEPRKILRGVYPEPRTQILRFAQDDNRRRARNDRLEKGSDTKRVQARPSCKIMKKD